MRISQTRCPYTGMGSFKSFNLIKGFQSKTALLSAVHFAVDMYCAVLFFGCISGTASAWKAMVLYNACAFALQAPIGAIADRLDNGKAVAAAGCLLLAASWFFNSMPIVCAVIAGLGNGAFHAGAGLTVLKAEHERASGLGVFVSTGAIGLFCGTADSGVLVKGGWAFVILFVLLAAGLLLLIREDKYLEGADEKGGPSLDMPKGGVWALICLFAVVALRAFIGSTACFAIPDMPGAASVLCVAGGKAIGGFIMDRVGPRKASVFSLLPCAVMVLFGTGMAAGQVTRLVALLLFNMTMPITLFAAARLLKNARGFAFGLLTFALFAGYIPRFLNFDTAVIPQYGFALLIMLSLALLIFGLGYEGGRKGA